MCHRHKCGQCKWWVHIHKLPAALEPGRFVLLMVLYHESISRTLMGYVRPRSSFTIIVDAQSCFAVIGHSPFWLSVFQLFVYYHISMLWLAFLVIANRSHSWWHPHHHTSVPVVYRPHLKYAAHSDNRTRSLIQSRTSDATPRKLANAYRITSPVDAWVTPTICADFNAVSPPGDTTSVYDARHIETSIHHRPLSFLHPR